MNKAPRIWHLLSNRWNSAITEYALSAARALQAQGCPTLFSPLQGSPAEQRALGYGLPCASIARFDLRALGRLRTLAADEPPAAVLVYGGPEAFLSRFLGRLGAQEPFVVRFRGHELGTPPPRALWFRLAHSHVSSLITAGTELQGQVQALLPGKPVAFIPLGVDAEQFYHDPPLAAAVEKNPRPMLLLVGRLDPIKGHAHFLRLFAALLARWPQVVAAGTPRPQPPCLHIVGEPANLSQAQLQALVREQGLRLGDDVVLSCRRLPNLREVMSAAALGIVASLGSEQICRVAEEFLLCGTPLLVSRAGALQDVLFAGAGEAYAAGSDEEVVSQLGRLVADSVQESRDQRLQRAARAQAYFSLPRMGEALLEHLAELKQGR